LWLVSWETQRSKLKRGGSALKSPGFSPQRPNWTDVKLRCTSFDWVSSWAPASQLEHGGRASMAFLKEHPEEENSIHLVLD
jgi:hypothetical protein